MKKRVGILLAAALLAFTVDITEAFAARSGGSFGGRGGFRTSRSSGGGYARGYNTPRSGGSTFVFLPSFGWGFGGYGGGGMGMFGTLIMVAVVGFGVVMVMKAMRRARSGAAGNSPWMGLTGGQYDDDDEVEATPDRAYVYKIQLGLGRSAREIQNRLAKFAAEGDTTSESGLAHLLHQTALELMREKHSIRYGLMEAGGPMSLTNGETKMNAASLAERSRFQVERVRGADGSVRRSDTAASQSNEALEYLVVTLVVATRRPVVATKEIGDPQQLQAVLGELGGVPADALLGLEVIWTPADPDDALTTNDLMTGYPELRSL
jgi:uncharacterized membrane protein